jgi:hypothetical protein
MDSNLDIQFMLNIIQILNLEAEIDSIMELAQKLSTICFSNSGCDTI